MLRDQKTSLGKSLGGLLLESCVWQRAVEDMKMIRIFLRCIFVSLLMR